LLASGCVSALVERYEHEPTARIPSNRWMERRVLHQKKFRPAEGEVLMVPDFSAFSSAFPNPHSFLHVFTRGNRPVFIVGAELEVPETGYKQTIELNVLTKPVMLVRDHGYWGARLRLFSDDRFTTSNVEFSKIRGADNLILTIWWRDGERTIEQRFPLRRVVRKETGFIT
jgi:hypothetical protein